MIVICTVIELLSNSSAIGAEMITAILDHRAELELVGVLAAISTLAVVAWVARTHVR